MIKQKLPVVPLIIAVFWLIALAFATRYDLEISLAIADENSFFGRALEVLGEPPAILFTSFNFSLMFSHFVKKFHKTWKDILFAILTLVGSVGTVIFTVNTVSDYLHIGIAPGVLSSIIVGAIILNSLRISKESADKYFSVACRCAAVACATFVIIWLIKLGWGRVRFRQLEDLADFTPWYLPQGFNGYFSFPSGHTANATVICTAAYYLDFTPKNLAKIKPIVYLLLGIWVILLALSRVLVGAHYLSDVLFGGAITFALVYLAKPKNPLQ